MTEHLSECPIGTKDAICCSIACICEALRPCEERVLDAAREAVAALLAYESPMGPLIRTVAALAAIDALREELHD